MSPILFRARPKAISALIPAISNARDTLLSSTGIKALALPRFASGTWEGRQLEEHVTNQKDELNVQSNASKSGGQERAAGDSGQSSATSEKDPEDQNKKAKKDHPEAPGPVIGMNDERGGVSHNSFLFLKDILDERIMTD
ncbi:hypothetical protein MMC07_000725 [Pseudocyphellaria aurata]|nr:hypothetical protein [Pseudocyphellaria aurata]